MTNAAAGAGCGGASGTKFRNQTVLQRWNELYCAAAGVVRLSETAAVSTLGRSMGIADRDYVRQSPPPRGGVGAWSITTWLLIINIAVFFLDPMLMRLGVRYVFPLNGERLPPLWGLGHFSIWLAVYHLEVWRFISFQFLHANTTHLFFNMFSLFFFGPVIEDYLGRGRFLVFYLLCGIGGPISYIILTAAHLLGGSIYVPLVGASAGIFGVLIAAAQIAPNATVFVFGILPMPLKNVAWLLVIVAVFTVAEFGRTGQGNAGGEAAHIGGAAVGYILIQIPQLLRLPSFRRRPPF
jgi:membrane associated rhomboid family serine protease